VIIHPQDNIKDIIEHTGLIRESYETHDGKVIYFIKKEIETLVKKHFYDLTKINYEVVDNLDKTTIFKYMLGQYKNCKIRLFFGMFDKLRLDSYKNVFESKYNNENYNPYTMYGFDESIRYDKFRINILEDDDMKTLKLLKSVANMNYRIFASGPGIPIVYKRNSTIAIQIDRVFDIKNYFDCVVLIKNTKHIHITDQKDDLFSIFVFHLLRSNQYEYLFDKKSIYYFYNGQPPTTIDFVGNWKFIEAEIK
tara:strand:+ start:3632 stop:4384 length:753 start_codon:yes stop_codon:yes gene_type:complete